MTRPSIFMALTSGALFLACSSAFAGDSPWSEPFAGEPRAMLSAAEALAPPEDQDWDMLLQESIVSLDENGLATRSWRYIFRVLTTDGLEPGNLSTSWAPWYQARAEIQARVILPDGTVREPAEDTFLESAEGNDGGSMYSDRRVLEAPYPGLEVGAIIEEQYTIREERPFFEAGSVHEIVLEPSLPTREVVGRLIAPKRLKPTTIAHRLEDVRPTRSTVDGHTVTEWLLTDVESLGWTALPPRDTSQSRLVQVGTGQSWREVAAAYSEMVDARLAESPEVMKELAVTARALVADAPDDWTRADRLLDWVHTNVRYTGLEFGEAALVPVAPSTVMERGFGDCKDQSTLLVGLLRSVGMTAHVALLQVSSTLDVSPDLPGMGQFDHAIVHVATSEGDLFLEPTLPGALAGQLTQSEHSRNVLVASPRTRKLTPTPPRTIEQAEVRYITEYRLGDGAPGSLRYLYEYEGEAALDHRLDAEFPDALKGRWADWIEAEHPGVDVGLDHSVVAPRTRETVVIDATLHGMPGTWADGDFVEVPLDWLEPLEKVPGLLEYLPGDDSSPRTIDVELVAGIDETVEVRVMPPAGFALLDPPEDLDVDLLIGTYTARFSTDESGSYTARLRFVAPPQRLDPAELLAAQTAISVFQKRPPRALRFEHRSITLTEHGDLKGALDASRPDEAAPTARAMARRADALMAAGLMDAATKAARRATVLDPEEIRGWLSLAQVLSFNRFGLAGRNPKFLEEAKAAAQRAYDLDPALPWAKEVLALASIRGVDGRNFGPGADLATSARLFGSLADDHGLVAYRSTQLAALGFGGDIDGLAKLLPERPADGQQQVLKLFVQGTRGTPEETERLARSWGLGESQIASIMLGMPLLLLRVGEIDRGVALLRHLTSQRGEDPTLSRILDAALDGPLLPSLAPKKPEAPVMEALERSARGELLDDSLLTSEALAAADLADLRYALSPVMVKDDLDVLGSAAWPMMLRGGLEFDVQGDRKSGWLVQARMAAVVSVPQRWAFFVVPGKDGARILGEANALPGPVLDAIAARLEAGQIARASELMTLYELGAEGNVEWISDALGDQGEETVTRASLALARCGLKTERGCMETLTTALHAMPEDARAWTLLHLVAMSFWWESGELERAASLANKVLAGKKSTLPELIGMALGVIHAVEGPEAAEALLPDATSRLTPWDVDRVRRSIARYSGDLDEAYERSQAMATSDPEDGNLNTAAWYAVVLGRVDDESLRQVQEAVRKTPGDDERMLHTLAAVLAELDRPRDALAALQKSVTHTERTFETYDAYVVGRIAEGLGELEAAVALYEEALVKHDADADAWMAAERRLEGLQ